MIASKFFRKMILTRLQPKCKSILIVNNSNKYINCTSVLNCDYSIFSDKMKNVYFSTQYPYDQKRFYTNVDRKNLNYKLEKSKQLLTEKRIRIRERKDILVQGIRDKKLKVQVKVREMEEIVEREKLRENILTIPNFLCVTRSCLAPYIGYIIVQEHYQLAIGLLFLAGLTDVVSQEELLIRFF